MTERERFRTRGVLYRINDDYGVREGIRRARRPVCRGRRRRATTSRCARRPCEKCRRPSKRCAQVVENPAEARALPRKPGAVPNYAGDFPAAEARGAADRNRECSACWRWHSRSSVRSQMSAGDGNVPRRWSDRLPGRFLHGLGSRRTSRCMKGVFGRREDSRGGALLIWQSKEQRQGRRKVRGACLCCVC